MKTRIFVLLLLFSLSYGVVSRMFWLSKSPPSLNWDEASLGYNAYSLMQTGRDEYGRLMPITLRSFDDYKGAVYAYLSIPFIKLLGLNQTAVRLPSVLAGMGLIWLAYLLGRKIDSEMAGVWASLTVAVSSWGIIFARTAFESNLALFFLMLGVYLLLFRPKSGRRLFWGSFWLVLSMYTYHSEKIFAPLIFLWVFWRYRDFYSKKRVLWFGGFLLALGLPLAVSILFGGGGSRFAGTSIAKLWPFRPQQAVLFPLSFPFYALNEMIGRLLAPLSLATLFVRGSQTGSQQLYLAGIYPVILAPVFLIGVWGLLVGAKKYTPLFLLLLIFGLIPAISWDWFRLVRSLPFVFVLAVVMGIGVRLAYQKLGRWRNWILTVFVGLVALEGVYNLNSAWMSVPTYLGGDYQDGMKQMVEKVKQLEGPYETVIIDTSQAQGYIFMLFYSRFDPAEYQRLSAELSQEELKEHSRFGKYEFRSLYWPRDQKLEKALLITSPINIGDEKIADVKDSEVEIVDRIYGIRHKEETVRFISVNLN